MKIIRPFALFSFALFLSACQFSLAADVTPPPGYQQPAVAQTQPAAVALSGPLYPLVPPDPAQGAPIFAEKCTPCHGDTGKGDGPRAAQLPNPVAAIGDPDVARQSTPAGWFSILTQGNLERFMPPFASLSERQRWDVLAYVYSLSVPETRIAQGKQLFQANCARCHGEQGQGDGPDAAALTTPLKNLTDQQFMAGKSAADFYQAITAGVPPDMPAFDNQLSEDERWALSEYLRSLTFAGNGQIAAVATPGTAETTIQPGETPSSPGVTATPVMSGTLKMGVVTGQVKNASGGEVPDDLTVTLHRFDQNMQDVVTRTTTLQPDGKFAFQDVEMPEGQVFLATVDYSGTTYGSDIGTVTTETLNIVLPISIYETTTDPSKLVVDRLHLFFDFTGAKTVQVIELYVISNTGDKTVVAPEQGKPNVTFKLPEGATNLQFQDGALGGRYLETPGGFADTIAVRPGTSSYQVLFAYDLPYDRKLDLVQSMTLPTNAVVALVPVGSIKIKGDNMQDAGTQDVQGTQYQMYNGSGLGIGEDLRLTVTGSPTSAVAGLSAGSKTNLMIGLGAFGAALILAGVWLYLRNRSLQAFDEVVDEDYGSGVPTTENAETLMDAILALDDLYREGQLPEEAYRARRAALKERLKELID